MVGYRGEKAATRLNMSGTVSPLLRGRFPQTLFRKDHVPLAGESLKRTLIGPQIQNQTLRRRCCQVGSKALLDRASLLKRKPATRGCEIPASEDVIAAGSLMYGPGQHTTFVTSRRSSASMQRTGMFDSGEHSEWPGMDDGCHTLSAAFHWVARR